MPDAPRRLAVFGALLIVVLFAGYGIGRLNASTVSASAPPATTGAATVMPGMAVDESQPHTHGPAAGPAAAAVVGGLSLSFGGLTLEPATDVLTTGRHQFTFRVAGAGGAAITTYAMVHDKPLHLIVVRRDLTGYQHLHPTMTADGTWGIDLTLAQPGVYRVIADFAAIVGGATIPATLGTDLTVAGAYAPVALPGPTRASTADGFQVSYEGTPSAQSVQPLLISVTTAGGGPAQLQPYLGAFGHLVMMRRGDLAYVHVHPEPQPVDGKVKFWVSVPSAGTYRMFFDFQVDGQVHTAAWTATVSP